MKYLLLISAFIICTYANTDAQNYCSSNLNKAIASYNEGNYHATTEIFGKDCLDPEKGFLGDFDIKRGYKVLIESLWGMDYDTEGDALYHRYAEYIRRSKPEASDETIKSDYLTKINIVKED